MKFKSQLSVVNVFFLVCLSIISVVMYQTTKSLIDTSGWVTHTFQVIGKANVLAKAMVDMETGQRGFLLTGKDRFLEPYVNGKLLFNQTMVNVLDLVSDNPPQVKRLQKAQQLKEHWLKSAGEYEINLKRKIERGEMPKEALFNILNGKMMNGHSQPLGIQSGKQIMDEIRVVIEDFIMLEESLMKQRYQENIATGEQAKSLAIFGAIFAIFFGGGAMIYMNRKLMAQLGAEPMMLMSMSQAVANGTLTARIKLDETMSISKDNVAVTLNHMADTLQL